MAYRNWIHHSGTLALGVGLLVAPVTGARASQRPPVERPQSAAVTEPEPVIMRASKVLDTRVDTLSGERLGEIRDLAVRLEDGTVPYAVLGIGGVLGVGSRYVAIPWDRFAIGPGRRLTLDVTAEELDLMSEFVMDAPWPAHLPASSDVDVEARTTVTDLESPTAVSSRPSPPAGGFDPTQRETVDVVGVFRGSRLIGMSVRNLEGEHLGQIDDLAVQRINGEIAYVVVAHGGLFGVGDSYVAVPLDRFNVNADDGVMILDATSQQLTDAPSFESHWPATVPEPF